MSKNKFILQGTAKWSYDYEMAEFTSTQKIMASMTSFIPPLHRHEGNIVLTNSEIIIEGTGNDKVNLTIQLNKLKQLYLGFDELVPGHISKKPWIIMAAIADRILSFRALERSPSTLLLILMACSPMISESVQNGAYIKWLG